MNSKVKKFLLVLSGAILAFSGYYLYIIPRESKASPSVTAISSSSTSSSTSSSISTSNSTSNSQEGKSLPSLGEGGKESKKNLPEDLSLTQGIAHPLPKEEEQVEEEAQYSLPVTSLAKVHQLCHFVYDLSFPDGKTYDNEKGKVISASKLSELASYNKDYPLLSKDEQGKLLEIFKDSLLTTPEGNFVIKEYIFPQGHRVKVKVSDFAEVWGAEYKENFVRVGRGKALVVFNNQLETTTSAILALPVNYPQPVNFDSFYLLAALSTLKTPEHQDNACLLFFTPDTKSKEGERILKQVLN